MTKWEEANSMINLRENTKLRLKELIPNKTFNEIIKILENFNNYYQEILLALDVGFYKDCFDDKRIILKTKQGCKSKISKVRVHNGLKNTLEMMGEALYQKNNFLKWDKSPERRFYYYEYKIGKKIKNFQSCNDIVEELIYHYSNYSNIIYEKEKIWKENNPDYIFETNYMEFDINKDKKAEFIKRLMENHLPRNQPFVLISRNVETEAEYQARVIQHQAIIEQEVRIQEIKKSKEIEMEFKKEIEQIELDLFINQESE